MRGHSERPAMRRQYYRIGVTDKKDICYEQRSVEVVKCWSEVKGRCAGKRMRCGSEAVVVAHRVPSGAGTVIDHYTTLHSAANDQFNTVQH